MAGFGLLSYAVACAAFSALAIFAFISDRRIRAGQALALAAAASAGWAALYTILESGRIVPDWLVVIAEVVRSAGWLYFLLLLAPQNMPRAVRVLVPLLLTVWALLAFFFADSYRTLALGGLAATLMGFVLLDQIFRNAAGDARRDLKYLLIGVGGLLVFDLFLFSQAELLQGFDPNSWHARGLVHALVVPFLIVGARRLPHVRFELYVSRQVTFYTTALIAVGSYALAMAGAGFLISRFGGAWGEALRVVFLGAAVLVLAAVIGSATIRRQLMVFLSKHFYRARYDYRVEWLRFIRTLSAASVSDVPAAAVRSVAQILGSPGGVLFRQPDGAAAFVPVASWPGTIDGLNDTHAIGANSPVIEFIRTKRWIVDLRERETQPDLYDNAEVPAWLASDPRWRLVSPIFFGDSLLGFFLLLEPPAPFRLMFEDRDLLNTAGQHVATLLAQQDADRRIAELSQFETYNRLTTFVMHDLKNSAAQLSLLVSNAARHKHNPQFIDDAISTIAQTSERMMRLIEQLRRQSIETTTRPVALQDALKAALDRCAAREPTPTLESGPERSCMVSADPERLIAALEHVIRNAQEASGEHGEVILSLEELGGEARISVWDTGAGMDPEFIRSRLFRPFDTTKGANGMGIGAYQARELARGMGGDVEVQSEPGRGTRFLFHFPLLPQ